MTDQHSSADQQTYARAVNAAKLGLVVQGVLALGAIPLAMWTQNPAAHSAMWYLITGIPVWLILLAVYHQHRLERIEALEAEQLAQQRQQTKIFQSEADELASARRRLQALQKWGLNSVGVFTALMLLGIGSWQLWHRLGMLARITDDGASNALYDQTLAGDAGPIVLLAVAGVMAFLLFATARYIAGMTRVKPWQLLRGGSGFLMGNCLVMLLVFIGAVAYHLEYVWVLAWAGLAAPALLAMLGVETIIAFLVNAYSPRRAGEVPRPAFDSRILSFLTSPESLGRIISETLNYQFGFEVSRSWFYRLLGKALTPMCIFALLVLAGISSVVVVEPNERAVITHFGRIAAIAEPGPHLKLPWPMGRVTRYPVGEVRVMHLGAKPMLETPEGEPVARLWTNVHVAEGHEERLLGAAPTALVDPGQRDEAVEPEATGWSLVASGAVVHYRIRDLQAYVTSAENADELLELVSDNRITEYFATRDVDYLVTEGFARGGNTLRRQIQADVDAMGLGIEVMLVSIANTHPPVQGEVAVAFQEQLNAVQEAENMRLTARTEADELLAQVAGTAERAREIDAAIRQLEGLETELGRAEADGIDADTLAQLNQDVEQQRLAIEQMLATTSGSAAVQVYTARAFRWEHLLTEQGQRALFEAHHEAYQKAPRYYLFTLYHDAMLEAMPDVAKIIVPEGVEPPIYRIDAKEMGGLERFFQPRD